MSRFDIIAHLGRKKELTADLDYLDYHDWEGSLLVCLPRSRSALDLSDTPLGPIDKIHKLTIIYNRV